VRKNGEVRRVENKVKEKIDLETQVISEKIKE
jgi:hypothetical protein